MSNCFLATTKMRKELGIKDRELVLPDEGKGIGHWYTDLIRVGSKKGVIFVHPSTRYTMVALDRKRPAIRQIDELFGKLLREVLFAEGVGKPVIDSILTEYQDIKIGKTIDKSVLGTMTDMVRNVKWYLNGPEEFIPANEIKLSCRLSRIPIVATKKGFFPYKTFTSLLSEQFGIKGEFSGKV